MKEKGDNFWQESVLLMPKMFFGKEKRFLGGGGVF